MIIPALVLLITSCGNNKKTEEKIYDVMILQGDTWHAYEDGHYRKATSPVTWVVNINKKAAYSNGEYYHIFEDYYDRESGYIIYFYKEGLRVPIYTDVKAGDGEFVQFYESYDGSITEYTYNLTHGEILECSESEWNDIVDKYNLKEK